MQRRSIQQLLLAVFLFSCVAFSWHEDPANNLLKNVYFTDGLHDWSGANADLAVVDGIDRPLMTVKSRVGPASGANPGITQNAVVEAGSRYRLMIRGYGTGKAQIFPWAGKGNVNYEWSKSVSLPQLNSNTIFVDFTVPAGVTSIAVGALFSGSQALGESMVLEFISLMKFEPNWLTSTVPEDWRAMNGVTRAQTPLPNLSVTATSVRDSVSNGQQQNGLFMEGVTVLPAQRYRLTLTGRRSSATGFVVPRISRASDSQLIVTPSTIGTVKAYSLPVSASTNGEVVYEFDTPESVSRIQVAVVFSTLAVAGVSFKPGDTFTLTSWKMMLLPNLLPDGELNYGVGPWAVNGDASMIPIADGGDNALELTTNSAQGTPGIRLDKVPVVPGRTYNFAARARIVSREGSAYPWIQEPDGEDLYWVYKDSWPTSDKDAEWRGAIFIAPRGVNWVNIGLLFTKHPAPFAAGDKLVMRSAILTDNGPDCFGRPPPAPVRPVPPPPPPPAVIPEPPPAPPLPWADAEKQPINKDALLAKVVRATANTRKPDATCDQEKFKFLKDEDWDDFAKCAASCQVTFYNAGEAGDNKGYDNYRVCYDCCAIRNEENEGLTQTGSGSKSWVPVTASMIENHRITNVDAVYRADKIGRLFISGRSTNPGCGQGTGAGMAVFIKGPWTKITYTETFKGKAACAGVFGGANGFMGAGLDTGLFPYSKEAGDLIYDRINMKTYEPSAPVVASADCSAPQQGWWNAAAVPGPMSATAALRRNPAAMFAGIATGTNCGLAEWEFSDIYVWM